VCDANNSGNVLFFDEITSQIGHEPRVKNQQDSGIGCMREESVGALLNARGCIDRQSVTRVARMRAFVGSKTNRRKDIRQD
jgi:hypothetical protein